MFKNMMKIRRRNLIRIISYASSVFIFLGIATYAGYNRAIRFRTQLEYGYQQAISELGDYINNIDIALEKGLYAGTNAQLMGLSAKILKEASNAKLALAHLPVNDLQLENTYKFLSQVGNFSISVSHHLEENQQVSEEERETLGTLSQFAKTLSGQISDIQMKISDGRLQISEVKQSIQEQNKNAENEHFSMEVSFKEVEEGFTDFPTLIYDGPFSDHISQRKPKLLEGKEEISEEKAKEIAAGFLGLKSHTLQPDNPNAGTLPTFNFQAVDINISVTKQGGYVLHSLNSRGIGEPKLTGDEAVAAAEKFLKGKGYTGLKNNYFEISNDICTVNFDHMEGDYVCYPDIIKVSVAMDDGAVVGFDAQGYIMNHFKRDIPKEKISEAEARAVVNPILVIDSTVKAIIPTEGLNEIPCYEFTCTGPKGEIIKVYVNTQTKREENILVIIQNDNGTLAF